MQFCYHHRAGGRARCIVGLYMNDIYGEDGELMISSDLEGATKDVLDRVLWFKHCPVCGRSNVHLAKRLASPGANKWVGRDF